MKYILVEFPDVQIFMEYSWFRQECYLVQAFEDQEYAPDSAYFVPESRYNEVIGQQG